MNKYPSYNELPKRIFDFNISAFDMLALEIFRFQYAHNEIYRRFVDIRNVNPADIQKVERIPFLPITFFKSHRVQTTEFEPSCIFESSGTTQSVNSKHYIKDAGLYTENFIKGFEQFYGNTRDWCILGLLPSYLERSNSSLVMMVDELIRRSGHAKSGFYVHQYGELAECLNVLERQQQKTLLIGVTFALLDFAEAYPLELKCTTVMETGGMKGRRAEIIRAEVHDQLKAAFKVSKIHSEYGMTELLSQAYSGGDGIFCTTDRMKVLLRSEDDPYRILKQGDKEQHGIINVIDLANLYSCSFIATDDSGRLYPDGSFEVLGRVDNSDIRGCSLMAL